MDKNSEMKLTQENLELRRRVRELEEELQNCYAALQFAGDCAEIDFLTGIYNRKGVTRRIENLLGRENRDCGALCFLDLDNFKNINDRYGHRYGDEVLCSVVQSICASVKKGDVVGRFGGDEFLVYFHAPEDREDIVRRAETVCRCIREDHADHGLTASIGVSRYPQDGLEFTSLLESADRALYQSKKTGKDRMSFFWKE